MNPDWQIKQQIKDTKKLRDKLVEKLVESPWNSETAMHIIGLNKSIETLWYMLGNEAKYEEGMNPYLKGDAN